MFEQPASVQLSGPAFSFLLYETCKAELRQDGFLLGEIIHKETITITDNDQQQIDISKIIKINSVMPIPPDSQFCNRGLVDSEKVRKYLGSNFDKVVAWYKYQPFSNSGFEFTLKDKAIHKQFRELFDIPFELFTCCFMSMEYTPSQATFNYVQSFQRYYNGMYDRLCVTIPNLSEPNNTYKNSEPASFSFNKILSNLNVNIQNSKGIVAITEIENAVQKYINETAAELAKREKYMHELEVEVRQLKFKKSCPHIDVESDHSESITQNNKYQEEQDLISFEEEPPETPPPAEMNNVSYAQKVAQKNEDSPDWSRKVVNPAVRGRTRKKSDSSDTEIDRSPELDSNKQISQDSPKAALESQQRIRNTMNATSTPRGRGTATRAKKYVPRSER